MVHLHLFNPLGTQKRMLLNSRGLVGRWNYMDTRSPINLKNPWTAGAAAASRAPKLSVHCGGETTDHLTPISLPVSKT